MQDKPKEDIDLEQRIFHLERENKRLKIQMKHDEIAVKAARDFLKYLTTEFWLRVPEYLKLEFERKWELPDESIQ